MRDAVSILGRRRGVVFGVVLALVAAIAAGVLFACSQNPQSVPVRTFERAQRMDVACLQLYAADGNRQEPAGRRQEECAPTPSGALTPQNQLFAFVTQTTRGEVAVVNLSAGVLQDLSKATPGINFLPVGALPTDIAASPDGTMVFVASAETNKAAIYGIPTRRALGDNPDFPHDPAPITLASWPVCALPQNPAALAVIPRRGGVAADAGASDAGAGEPEAPYDELVVVLPGDRIHSGKIITVDTRPFRRGALVDDPVDGPSIAPGSLEPCVVTSAIELVGGDVVPAVASAGGSWDDGVKWVDGGADLSCLRPERALRCGPRLCCGAEAPIDGGVDLGPCVDPAPPDAGPRALDLGPLDPPKLVKMVRADDILYVADEGVPLIHVIDMSTPGAPRELPPLVATSEAQPSRVVTLKDLAISPPTRDYKRYLYAVDRSEGSLVVFDVTDPRSEKRTPLTHPHPELNPLQPPDRIAFASPIVSVAFARHDVPPPTIDGQRPVKFAPGVLCNPNPAANGATDPGVFYRPSTQDTSVLGGPDPRRLRGIFAFATLANGQVAAIDVDDWDSPCRRPADLNAARRVADAGIASAFPAQPDTGDSDPYHAPSVSNLSVTNEVFFPMTAPHSARSDVMMREDSTGGGIPRTQSSPVASLKGATLPQVGPGNENTPRLGMAFSFDEPRAHIDQDWTLTYEGALPGFDGLAATITPGTEYGSVFLDQAQAHFCARGVEDWELGRERTLAIARARGALPQRASERWMGDYVSIVDELLPPSDPYWEIKNQTCWAGDLADRSGRSRYDFCARAFGPAADENPQRDYPIIAAYDEKLELGRFYTSRAPACGANNACAAGLDCVNDICVAKCDDERGNVCAGVGSACLKDDPARADVAASSGASEQRAPRHCVPRRSIVGVDPSNADDLKLMDCCFHHLVRFKVRTGALWSAVGQAVGGGPGVGFLSHLTTDAGGRCVASCEPRDALLNGRLPTVPVLTEEDRAVDPNSALAMRNPMFVAVISARPNLVPTRDTTYSFSTRGQFRPLFVNITGGGISVSPQSMRFVDALGQMAVVDGASQGLVLIDLSRVTVARAPYF